YVGVPITGLTVEALGGTAKDKGKNIFVLGLIAKIFNLDVEKLKKLIAEKFAGKDESIVNTALMAFQAGYAYPVGKVLTHHYRFEHIPKPGGRAQITMDGNQALAYGLIAAGVRYGAGYPITPCRRLWKRSGASSRNMAEFLSRPKTSLVRCRWLSAFRIRGISQSPAAPAQAFPSKPRQSA